MKVEELRADNLRLEQENRQMRRELTQETLRVTFEGTVAGTLTMKVLDWALLVFPRPHAYVVAIRVPRGYNILSLGSLRACSIYRT